MKTAKLVETFEQFQCECPHCGFTFWYTKVQLSNRKFFDVCSICSKTFSPERPPSIKFESTKIVSNVFNEALSVMLGIGYSKQEASQRLKQVFKEEKNIEKLVVDAVTL